MVVLGELVSVEGGFDVVGLRLVILVVVGERDVVFDVGASVVGFLLRVGANESTFDGAIVGETVPLFVERTVGVLVGAMFGGAV